MAGWIDSHCHLDSLDDPADAVERARAAGVEAIVTVGEDLESSCAAAGLASVHEPVWAAVGQHPHQAKTLSGDVREALTALAKAPKVVAIGETGLDQYRDLSPTTRCIGSSPRRERPNGLFSIASPAGRTRRGSPSISAGICPSRGTFPSPPPATCARRRGCVPPTGSWWRPTPPTLLPCPTERAGIRLQGWRSPGGSAGPPRRRGGRGHAGQRGAGVSSAAKRTFVDCCPAAAMPDRLPLRERGAPTPPLLGSRGGLRRLFHGREEGDPRRRRSGPHRDHFRSPGG